MLQALAILLLCQLTGEVAARSLGLPIPGPVIGLMLLVAALFVAARQGRVSDDTVDATQLGRTANGLLAVLGILFVPAGVGVIQQLGLLTQYGAALLVALLASTFLTLVVTVWVFIAVSRAFDKRT